jgi:phosphate transport system permease protein
VEAAPQTFSLRASGKARRRLAISRGVEATATLAAAGALAVLGWVIVSVLLKGLPALNLDFFTKNAPTFNPTGTTTGGGIANALVGTPIMVGLGTAMALPVGVLIAIYVSEFAPVSVGRSVKLALDVLNGVPSIVIGIFVFVLLIKGSGYNGYAGAFALAIIMLPLVSRATMEVLALVPAALREASFALGVSKWRTVLFVLMPTVFGGILTGTTLAVARAAGETAPMIFTNLVFNNTVSTDPGHALASIPLTIFNYSESFDSHLNDQAWAAAFVLMAFVLISSLTARALLSRSQRKLRGR